MAKPDTTLSDHAKGVAAIFSITSNMEFLMVESRPSAPMQAALDELVAAGVLWREPIGSDPVAVRYKPLHDCHQYRRCAKLADFPVTEPVHA